MSADLRHLDDFYAEYGYFANLDNLYHGAYQRVANTLSTVFTQISNVRIGWDRIMSEEHCILHKESRVVPIIGDISLRSKRRSLETKIVTKELMSLPYPTTNGYFILDGIEWAIVSLDVAYSTMIKVTKPPSQEEDKIKWEIEMRVETYKSDEYKSSTVFMDQEDRIGVYVNSMYKELGIPKSKLKTKRYVNAYIVYKMLKPEGSISTFIDDVANLIPTNHPRGKHMMYLMQTINRFNKVDTEEEYIECINSTVNCTLKKGNNKEENEDHVSVYKIVKDIVQRNFLSYPNITDKQRLDMLLIMIITLIARRIGSISTAEPDRLIYKKIDTPGFQFERKAVMDIYAVDRMVKEYTSQNQSLSYEENFNILAKLQEVSSGILNRLRSKTIMSYYRPRDEISMQNLSKRSILDVYSHIRRVRVNISEEQQSVTVRDLTVDQFGFYCAFETNDGKEAGLNKYLASTAIITDEIPLDLVERLIKDHRIEEKGSPLLMPSTEYYPTMINGIMSGFYKKEIIESIRKKRRFDKRYRFMSVSLLSENNFIDFLYIYTDKGRIMRPLLRVDGDEEYVEYLDQYEINHRDYVISMLGKPYGEESSYYTHREVNPSSMLGLSASMMPFSNYNNAARVAFESNMSKQAVCQDPVLRRGLTDDVRTLRYGHTELVSTRMSRQFNDGVRRTGCNIVIAIFPLGWNMDDSLVFKKQSIDRGLFVNSKTRYQRVDIMNISMIPTRLDLSKKTESDIISTDNIIRQNLPEHRFDHNGIINEGMTVKKDGIVATYLKKIVDEYDDVVGRVMNTFHKDVRVEMVKEVKVDTSSYYNIIAKCTTIPQVGDKFAARYSQKGVTGKTINNDMLPYTKSGIVPDVVVNPHSIPSRMTVGMLLEILMNKAVACGEDLGEEVNEMIKDGYYDATPFVDKDYLDLIKTIEKHGVNIKEDMYNPMTGEKVEGGVFLGICNYMCLKHFVDDKMFYRTVGPTKFTSRHPTEGKSEGGGLRFGIMEFDSLIAHNATNTIMDKTRNETDSFITYVCERCHSILNVPDLPCAKCKMHYLSKYEGKRNATSSSIRKAKKFSEVDTTNSFRMTVQYMNAAGINVLAETV